MNSVCTLPPHVLCGVHNAPSPPHGRRGGEYGVEQSLWMDGKCTCPGVLPALFIRPPFLLQVTFEQKEQLPVRSLGHGIVDPAVFVWKFADKSYPVLL